MQIRSLEILAKGAAKGHAFLHLDLKMVSGANRMDAALGELGDDLPERLVHGPIAIQFTDRDEASATFSRILGALRQDTDAVRGTISLVTVETTRREAIG